MGVKNRSAEEQLRINEYMNRPDVLEYVLHQALNGQPASPDEVNKVLRSAPPEVRILLRNLTLQFDNESPPSKEDAARNDRITAGVVGWLLREGAAL